MPFPAACPRAWPASVCTKTDTARPRASKRQPSCSRLTLAGKLQCERRLSSFCSDKGFGRSHRERSGDSATTRRFTPPCSEQGKNAETRRPSLSKTRSSFRLVGVPLLGPLAPLQVHSCRVHLRGTPPAPVYPPSRHGRGVGGPGQIAASPQYLSQSMARE